jgi:hypothetical protein
MLTENSESRGRVQILEVLGLWTSRETPSESPSVLQLSLVTDIEKFAAELSRVIRRFAEKQVREQSYLHRQKRK